MCWCNPHIRTPWCGKPGCNEPAVTQVEAAKAAEADAVFRREYLGEPFATDCYKPLQTATDSPRTSQLMTLERLQSVLADVVYGSWEFRVGILDAPDGGWTNGTATTWMRGGRREHDREDQDRHRASFWVAWAYDGRRIAALSRRGG